MSDPTPDKKKAYLSPALHSRPVAHVERLIADVYALQTERWREQSKRRRPKANSSEGAAATTPEV